MPELPEVETVVRTLEKQIKDAKIVDVKILYKPIVENPTSFKKKIINQHFRKFSRRGKYLLFYLDDYLFVSHLRMEGKYFIKDPNEEINKHEHVIFTLDNGKQLRYHDTRKFGRMELVDINTDLNNFHNLGVEPFDKAFNKKYVKEYLKDKKCPIKQCLLDQSFIAGIGNIYADEILFYMKVDPRSKACKLNDTDIDNLIKGTKSILKKAIKAGGTTIRSYTSSLGVTGRFQLQVNVHSRQNEKCHVCGTPIEKITVATRGTYFCPKCQKIRK